MKTTTSIKLDKEVKDEARRLAKELGVPLGTIVNAQLKQFVKDRSVVLSAVPRMSAYIEELLGPIERDIEAGQNLSAPVQTAEDLDAALGV